MARTDPLLSTQISLLVDAVDGGEVPPKDKLMGKLMKMLPAAQSLESGQALVESEAQVTALEKQVKDIQAMHKTQLDELKAESANLESLLEKASDEINRIRTEEKARNQRRTKKEELVLIYLNPIGVGAKAMEEVAIDCDMTMDLADALLKRLKRDELADWHFFDDRALWYRSDAGGEYLLGFDLLK